MCARAGYPVVCAGAGYPDGCAATRYFGGCAGVCADMEINPGFFSHLLDLM